MYIYIRIYDAYMYVDMCLHSYVFKDIHLRTYI
jgi:hypothetical protein